jgi:hypothetical protein
MTLLPHTFTRVDDASSPPRTLAGFSHPILGREPDAHFLMWMMLPRRRELSPGFLTQYWAENEMPTFMWMMPPRRRIFSPGFLTQYWAENLTPTFSCG